MLSRGQVCDRGACGSYSSRACAIDETVDCGTGEGEGSCFNTWYKELWRRGLAGDGGDDAVAFGKTRRPKGLTGGGLFW
jgi:hypothetical protein